jgi:hypothetical protein
MTCWAQSQETQAVSELFARIVDGTLIWLAVLLISSLCCALLYPAFRSRYRLAPDVAATFQLAWGLLPLLAATGVTLLVLNPALSAALIPEHCHDGDCLPHAPDSGLGTTTGLVIAAVTSALLLSCSMLLARALNRIRRRLHTLRMLSRTAHDQPYWIIDTDRPLAWCVGFWRPQVYLSRGLLTRLTSEQVQVVLAHERSHSLRQDNLRRLLLQLATLLWPRPLRRRLLSDFHCTTEQACDLVAAEIARNPCDVTELIRFLAQAPQGPRERSRQHFTVTALEQRLQTLQAPVDKQDRGHWPMLVLALLWLVQVTLLATLAHGGLELLATASAM